MYQAIYYMIRHIYNKMTYIYYLTYKNQDKPFYIGKSVNCKSRFYQHRETYGKNIKLVEIDKVKDSTWLFWERYYISLFKSWGFKLTNQNNGGGGSTRSSKEKKLKLKLLKSIPILQYDLQGNFIKEYLSAKQYAEENNLTNGGLIGLCLKNKKPTAYGYIWKYKTEDYSKTIVPPIKYINNFTPILQYDLQGNFIKEWPSIKIASTELNINDKGICNSLKGRAQSSGGYIWKYKN